MISDQKINDDLHQKEILLKIENDKKLFEHNMSIDDKKYDNRYQSCCFDLDRRALIFFSQLTISLIVIAFTISMLYINMNDCATYAKYIGLLTLILGIWIDAPRLK
jgi:hypothetical protein